MVDFIIKFWTEILFTSILAWLAKTNDNKVKAEQEEKKRLMEENESLTREIEHLKTEITGLGCGVQALLKDKLLHSYYHYMDKGYYPVYAREVVDDLYKQYKSLGGNGVIPDLVVRLQDLPTEKNIK